jgi:hypothetical protein
LPPFLWTRLFDAQIRQTSLAEKPHCDLSSAQPHFANSGVLVDLDVTTAALTRTWHRVVWLRHYGTLTELMSQLSTAVSGNDPFVVEIALVADENDLRIVPRVRLDLRTPGQKKNSEFNACQRDDGKRTSAECDERRCEQAANKATTLSETWKEADEMVDTRSALSDPQSTCDVACAIIWAMAIFSFYRNTEAFVTLPIDRRMRMEWTSYFVSGCQHASVTE